MNFSRRRFMEIAGLAAGGIAVRSAFAPSIASASDDPSKLVLAVYFSGGGDHLLTLDPRPNDDPDYTSNEPSSKTAIFPAYDQVEDTNTLANLAASGPYKGLGKHSGIKLAGNLTFGPAIPDEFSKHYADLAILRGVFMGTLGHEVGRRYFITGKFPRGLTANGSSLATAVAASGGQNGATVPNLAVSCEAYNDIYPAYASPVGVTNNKDMLNLLKQLGTPLDAASTAALVAYQQRDLDCPEMRLDGDGQVTLFKGSIDKARTMVNSTASAEFNFTFNGATQQIQSLLSFFDCKTTADLSLGKGRAALAAQALTTGITQAVSLEIADNMDDHSDWATSHATTLWDGYWALGQLIQYLKTTPWKGGSTMTWDHTTMLVFSEFARTPLLNGRAGRDHNIASSCVVAGPGIKGNQIIGATSASPDDTSSGPASAPGMVARNVDFTTGKPDDKKGLTLRPQDIHATILTSMGLPYDELLNQQPQILEAILKNP